MTLRVCAEPGCPNLQPDTRCDKHRKRRTLASATARGYGATHQRLRAQWEPRVATGTVTCWRCNTLIPANTDWHLGHDDHDRTRYRGPEHTHCNLRAHKVRKVKGHNGTTPGG